jgi:hypothetical protein
MKQNWDFNALSIQEKDLLFERIRECHTDLQEIENAKENLKDAWEVAKSEIGIPKRTWNFLLKASFFGNGDEAVKKNEELVEAWNSFKMLLESKKL